jgi:Putative Ig domain
VKGSTLQVPIRKTIVAGAAVAAILGGSGVALAASTAANASTSAAPLQVTLVANGDSTAVFNSTGEPVLTAGTDSGTSAQIQVNSPSATAPATAPTFTSSPASSAGDPRWVVEFHNGCSLFGYGTSSGWSVNPGGPQSVDYATALSDAEACGADDNVTAAFIVVDAGDPGVPTSFSAVQYGGQTLSPGAVAVANPGIQTNTVSTAITPLQVIAHTNTSDNALTYSATSLPTGLTINSSTGVISGTPTATGSSAVTVTVTNAYGATGSVQFTWTVATATPPPPAVSTKLTGKYICGRTNSRLVWRVSNVQGGTEAIANFVSLVGGKWKFDYSRVVPANGTIRSITDAGAGLRVYYDLNGSLPAPHEAGAVHIRLATPVHRVRCG